LAYLGGLIVNDFTLYDRTWKVMIQAGACLSRDRREYLCDPSPQ